MGVLALTSTRGFSLACKPCGGNLLGTGLAEALNILQSKN